MIHLLDLEMWIIQVVFDIFMGAILFYILRFDNVFKCYVWNVIIFTGTAVGLSVPYKPINWFVRIIFYFITLYGLQWNAVFCAVLISCITKPLMSWQLDNIMDAIYYNYEFVVPSNYYVPHNLVILYFYFYIF